MAFQQPGERDARQRQRRLHRVADGVEQVVGVEPLPQRTTPRVDEYGSARFLGHRPELRQRRVVELDAGGGRRGDLHASQVQVGERGPELTHREVRVLQGHGADADEPVRPHGTELGDRLVGECCDAFGEVASGPVVRQRHRAHGLDVHPGLVHGGDPGVHVGQPHRQ
jgi:hypothetical protein